LTARLRLEYDGTEFAGWATHDAKPTRADDAVRISLASEGRVYLLAVNRMARPDVAAAFGAAHEHSGHYMQDAHVPLHASNNYDGQLTQQNGIHARFETALFERMGSKLTVTPGRVSAISNPRDAAFEVLLASYQLVDELLKADRDSVAGKDSYDDEYFDRLFARVRPMLEKRLADSVTATASVIVGAWEQAGKPALHIEMPRTVQKVRVR